MQAKFQNMKPDEINHFVQNMMGKVFQSPFPNDRNMNQQDFMANFHPFQSQNESGTSNESLQYSVFETHEDIFIRIVIESEEWLRALRLTHTSNLLILEHIPEYQDTHKILLPALVKRKGTTARFKDGVLEIKIPKNIDFQFSEVDITDLK